MVSTRATIEVHHCFSELSSVWELKTSARKPIWRENKTDTPDAKYHGLGTRRESCQKIACYDFFPDDCGLRSSFIQKPFQTKTALTSIVASVSPDIGCDNEPQGESQGKLIIGFPVLLEGFLCGALLPFRTSMRWMAVLTA